MNDITTTWKPIRIRPQDRQVVIAYDAATQTAVCGSFRSTFTMPSRITEKAKELLYIVVDTYDDEPEKWRWESFDIWTTLPVHRMTNAATNESLFVPNNEESS